MTTDGIVRYHSYAGDGVGGESSFAQRRHVKARATYTAPRRPRSGIILSRLVRELDRRAAGLVRIRDRKNHVMRAAATLAGQGSYLRVKRDSARERGVAMRFVYCYSMKATRMQCERWRRNMRRTGTS